MLKNIGLNSLPKIGEEMKELVSEIDGFINSLDKDEYSTEADLKEDLKIFVNNVSDYVSRVSATLKSNISNFGDRLKRSEIKFFTESHPKMIAAVENLSYDVVRNFVLPIPAGLNTTYMDAVTHINETYYAIDIESVSKNSINYFTKLYKLILSANKDSRLDEILKDVDALGPAADMIRLRVKKVEKLMNVCDKNFSDEKSKGKRVFKESYETMHEFRSIRTLLIGMELHLKRVPETMKAADDVDKIVGNIVDVINNTDKELPLDFIKEIAQLIRMSASLYDVYGTLAKRQTALEHNHILTIQALNEDVVKRGNTSQQQ